MRPRCTRTSMSRPDQVSLHGLEAPTISRHGRRVPSRVQPDEPVTFDGTTVDRIYYSTDTLRLDDPAWDRVIVIEAHGTKQTVTWNPGTAADTEIGDMQPGEWRDS